MIITNDESALRVFCHPVFPEEVGELVATLENELNAANRLGKNGIGLAAPQVGLAKHIAIIRLPNLSLNLVNAKIENGYDLTMIRGEGCLSFPGRVEDVMRYKEVHITNGVEPHHFIATDFLAQAIQHEADHCNSVLFMDRAPSKPPIELRGKSIDGLYYDDAAQFSATVKKQKPNDLCLCKSGKKFKKCCSLKGK